MKLINGREISVDLTKVTIKEWRLMWRLDTDNTISDAIFGRCIGLTAEEMEELPFTDFQKIAKAIRETAAHPLEDEKNSASASTSD